MTKPINSFPTYEYVMLDDGKYHNVYRDTDIGFGGYIISNPGIYTNVALLDVASLHPNSIRAMNCFGEYTKNFTDILDARVAIKHGDFESARKMLDGRLAPYLDDESKAKDLAQALKIAINSVYGLTAASFSNPFCDPRNKNNIVALRGALFMRTLQDEVENRGFKIVAIKTDSIKIADATKEIVDFCMEFAQKYSYTFEHEASYEKMCQINDADYVARYMNTDICESIYGYIPGDNKKHSGGWTATGKQFQVPYIFKTLFTREPIEFEDLCETKEVQTALYLDMNEGLTDVSIADQIKHLRMKHEEDMFGKSKTYSKEQRLLREWADWTDEDLDKYIAEGHNYRFVGKVGNFCPIKPGYGGGELVREGKDKHGNVKYNSATGAKGYRWLESEVVKTLGKEDDIDRSYYNKLVDAAKDAISQYGDFEWFVSDDEPEPKLDPPPWLVACGRETCEGCNNFIFENGQFSCKLGHDIGDMIQMNIMDELENDDFKKR